MHRFARFSALACASALATSIAVATPAPAATAVPLLGVTVTDGHDLVLDTAEFGHLPIIHTYFTGLPPAGAWGGLAGVNHSAVIVSFNAGTSAILSGRDDGVLLHFFTTAPTGHPIYYTYIHEPEHEVAHGGLSVSAYRSAWAHIVALAGRAHNASLVATEILESYDLKIGRNWRQYLPAGHIIKVLAWDAYPGTLGDSPQAPAQFLGPSIAASKSVGLRYGFAEFGLHAMTARASWLASVGSYLKTSGALFGTYFDSSIVSSYRLLSAADVTAWRHCVQAG